MTTEFEGLHVNPSPVGAALMVSVFCPELPRLLTSLLPLPNGLYVAITLTVLLPSGLPTVAGTIDTEHEPADKTHEGGFAKVTLAVPGGPWVQTTASPSTL